MKRNEFTQLRYRASPAEMCRLFVVDEQFDIENVRVVGTGRDKEVEIIFIRRLPEKSGQVSVDALKV